MSDTIQLRVARGTHWLDENEPGWDQNIDLLNLRMSSCARCVLGQLYGDFTFRPGNFPDVIDYGFEASRVNVDDEYPLLAQEWTRVIEQRQKG